MWQRSCLQCQLDCVGCMGPSGLPYNWTHNRCIDCCHAHTSKLAKGTPRCAGVERLRAGEAGGAVRLLGDARELLGSCAAAARAYDRVQPVTGAAGHEYADLALKDAVERPYGAVRCCPHSLLCL